MAAHRRKSSLVAMGHRSLAIIGAITILATSAVVSMPRSASAATSSLRSGDALHGRTLTDLANFTDWLEANDVDGYVGEVGWPNDGSPTDQDKWNTLAHDWFTDADSADLWVSAWTASANFAGNENLAYGSSSSGQLNTSYAQAPIIEAHGSTSSYKRGVNVPDLSFGYPNGSPATSTFSNVNYGTFGTHYYNVPQSGYDYLASKDIETIRLAFRWERIQPTLNSALNPVELVRLQQELQKIENAGMTAILDVHNFGEYYLTDGSQGVRRAIGDAQLPASALADLWTRLSTEFKNDSTVVAYDLMNEPANISPRSSGYVPATTRYNFNANSQGWNFEGGGGPTWTNAFSHSGAGSITHSQNWGGFSFKRFRENKNNLRNFSVDGDTISAWVYVPTGGSGSFNATTFIYNSSYSPTNGSTHPLVQGQWNLITDTFPTSVMQNVQDFGIQVTGNGVNATLPVYIDDVQVGSVSTAQSSAEVWESASQTTLDAIRANADTKLIMVSGYAYSSAATWSSTHSDAWISDPANNFRYQAHQYFDQNSSSIYTTGYSATLSDAEVRNYVGAGTAAPTGSLSVVDSSGVVATQSVDLQVTAVDDRDTSATLRMQVSEDPLFGGESRLEQFVPYSTTLPFSLSPGNGMKTVYARFRDAGGNVSAPVSTTVTLDSAAPEAFTPAVVGGVPVATRTPQIMFSTSDATTGVARYEVAVDGGAFVTATSPYTTAQLANGTHEVVVRALDEAGNHRDGSVSFAVDLEAPTINVMSITSDPQSITVAFTTNESTTTRVDYGPAGGAPYTGNIIGSSSDTTHSIVVPTAGPCFTYRFAITVETVDGRSATTSPTIATSKCSGVDNPTSIASGQILSTGGSVALMKSGVSVASVTMPVGVVPVGGLSTQIHEIPTAAFSTTSSAPAGQRFEGEFVYDIGALNSAGQAISAFSTPVFVRLRNTTGTPTENLDIYHLHAGSWKQLTECEASNDYLDCPTDGFSVFAFTSPVTSGSPIPAPSPSPSPPGPQAALPISGSLGFDSGLPSGDGSSGGRLAKTGTDVMAVGWLGAVFVVIGLGLRYLSRRCVSVGRHFRS